MTTQVKAFLPKVLELIVGVAVIAAVALSILCISLGASPSELYARLMNRPMDTPIIQVQSAQASPVLLSDLNED